MEFDPVCGPPEGGPRVSAQTLTDLAQTAFSRLSFTFTRKHLDHLVSIVTGQESGEEDRLIASYMLDNAIISSKGSLPLCQDTGTAQVFAWKDQGVVTEGDDIESLSAGAGLAWKSSNLRFSTTIPTSFFTEYDPGTNMPAQILVTSTSPVPGREPAYRFLFCAKGGGSSNKTSLVQGTRALLDREAFIPFLSRQIAALGTAACPPYSIAVVAGGLSPEQNLLALKLATAGYFDEEIPGFDYRVMGTSPFRDPDLEAQVLALAADSGLGAQFGGRAMAVSARVLRLPRHGASCPVSIGVSCSAHRNLHAYIDSRGVWLERTVTDPLSVPGLAEAASWHTGRGAAVVKIDTGIGLEGVRAALAGLKPGSPVLVSGEVLVARDAAHARWRSLLKGNRELPAYLANHIIMYAGPAETPPGRAIGSFGPTTAGRMDEYADELMSRGAALVTLAKGNRSEAWRSACARYGAVYLGSPGGIAALIAERHITGSRIVDYPELGMEAVRIVTVRDMPAFVLINGRGEDFYANIKEARSCR